MPKQQQRENRIVHAPQLYNIDRGVGRGTSKNTACYQTVEGMLSIELANAM